MPKSTRSSSPQRGRLICSLGREPVVNGALYPPLFSAPSGRLRPWNQSPRWGSTEEKGGAGVVPTQGLRHWATIMRPVGAQTAHADRDSESRLEIFCGRTRQTYSPCPRRPRGAARAKEPPFLGEPENAGIVPIGTKERAVRKSVLRPPKSCVESRTFRGTQYQFLLLQRPAWMLRFRRQARSRRWGAQRSARPGAPPRPTFLENPPRLGYGNAAGAVAGLCKHSFGRNTNRVRRPPEWT